ncbi:AAA family ATPase [Dongia deserti]|uniref:AAA family ATPase n=1 Tax=Dongia deserti TaxID=2268030 RepID=UPI000E64C002|nr:ATP-binding protein [Dongia deserti]
MPLPSEAPGWAAEIALAYESTAQGQFILSGNVHDRVPLNGALVNLVRFIETELLSGFQVIFTFDLGNGLRVVRGAELLGEWSGARSLEQGVRQPLAAIELVSSYLRYVANLRALRRGEPPHVACLLRGADEIVPATGGWNYEFGGIASLLRDWASEAPFCDLPFVSLLIADNLNDLHPSVALNPRAAKIKVPLPSVETLTTALTLLKRDHPEAFGAAGGDDARIAAALTGVAVVAVEAMCKQRAHQRRPIQPADLVGIKKELVERESSGLIEFIESKRTLADYEGQEPLKAWLRQDAALWHAGDIKALPKGYLICGPVGTGKTYLVECLAGEVGVPVVKLKNFRDRWVGSSEGNLEKIIGLVRALGRCMVFIDEADQALGRRNTDSSDSGLSGRLYAMIAQEMGDSTTRGRVIWILASSRPDLIEVDLKRPGRVDVKIPLFPTTKPDESARLLRALCRRVGLDASEEQLLRLGDKLPLLLTPGAAEAIAAKAYRIARTQSLEPTAAIEACVTDYQPPVPEDVLRFQMQLAVREATELAFVPEPLRKLADGASGALG